MRLAGITAGLLAALILVACGSNPNTALPTVSNHSAAHTTKPVKFGGPPPGSPAVGDILFTTSGNWSGSPTGFTYLWEGCNSSGGSCTTASGSPTNTQRYVIASGDIGGTIRVAVTAAYSGHPSATAVSEPTAVVASGGSAPVDTTAPYFCGVSSGESSNGGLVGGCSSVSGDAVVGQSLTVGTGAWTNSPTSFSYQWKDCTTTGAQPPTTASCSNISGATSSSYTVVTGDIGSAIVPIVTANNGGGSTSTSVAGSCDVGSTPGTNGDTGDSNGRQSDPLIAAGCSPISAVAASAANGQPGEEFCTNAPVTCGFPDPLSGGVGVPPGTSLSSVGSINCTGGTSGSPKVISDVSDVGGAVSIASHCRINDSFIQGSNNSAGFITVGSGITDVQFNNDELSGQSSGGACTFSNVSGGGTGANLSDILWEGNGSGISIDKSFLHCGAEALNGQTQATNSYLESDECWGPCGSGSTTHNEAVYFDGSTGSDGGFFNNDVILDPYGQTAAFFGDDHAFGPVQGLTVENSLLAGGYGSDGAIATGSAGDGNINVAITGNRISFLYSSSQPCGSNLPTSTGGIRDDTLAGYNC